MTETPQPTSGSLHAVVIRACPQHGPSCKKHRKIEDMGEVASFGPTARPTPTLPNPNVVLPTGDLASLVSRIAQVFRKG